MSETDPEFDIELEKIPHDSRPNIYSLLSKGDGKAVAAFSETLGGRHAFVYFCHGLAMHGSFRVRKGGEVIAERQPNDRRDVGWFNYFGLPCNPNNPF